MEHGKRLAWMRAAVPALVVLCLSSGCSLIMVGDPVKELDLSSEDNAEENLKAVRGMLANQAARSAPGEQPSGSLRPAFRSRASSERAHARHASSAISLFVRRNARRIRKASMDAVTARTARGARASCARLHDPGSGRTRLFRVNTVYSGRNGRPALRRAVTGTPGSVPFFTR
jgi:hypothetical protein